MTLLFDNFFKQILKEATSFKTLPDKPPYGFWIYPNGDFKIVPFQKHAKVAEMIIKNSSTLSARYEKYKKTIDKYIDYFDFLNTQKFIRVSIDVHSLEMDVTDVEYVSDGTGNYGYKLKTVPPKANKTIKDISAFYGGLSIVLDSDNEYTKRRIISFRKIMKESSDFSKLPDAVPYGFWVAPDGTFEILKDWNTGHLPTAKRIIYLKYKDEYEHGDEKDQYTFLFNKGYWRGVRDDSDMRMYFDNEEIAQQPSRIVNKVCKDLSKFYKYQCVIL